MFLELARALLGRERPAEAVAVLAIGLEKRPWHREANALLALAASQDGQHLRVLQVIEVLGPTPDRDPDLVALQVRALFGLGHLDRARGLAESLVMLYPAMGPVELLLDGRPPERERLRVIDPLITAARAEEFVALGRLDRAVRVYRRLLFHHPESQSLRDRLSDLLTQPHEPVLDDLSEELPDPSLIPPALTMPSLFREDKNTEPAPPRRAAGPLGPLEGDPDEEVTEPLGYRGGQRSSGES